MSDKDIKVCDSCGASVYPEHIDSGKAAVVAGKLRCPHCLTDYKKTHHMEVEGVIGQTSMRAPGEGDDLSAVSLSPDDKPGGSSVALRSIGSDTMLSMEVQHDDSEYKRPLVTDSLGATRCRTFHAKLNDGAVAFMNKHINDWVDNDPDVTIKTSSSTIGIWEGKKADPHLIVTVFY